MEKKQRAAKYHVATKEHREPLVVLAQDKKEAAEKWAKRTGKKIAEAVVREIGTQAESITRPNASSAPEAVKK